MDQMFLWAMIHREFTARRQRPKSDDEFYRMADCGDGPTWRLLRALRSRPAIRR